MLGERDTEYGDSINVMKLRLSIKQYIITFCVLTIVISTSIVGYSMFVSAKSTIRKIITTHQIEKSDTLKNSLMTFINDAQRINLMTHELITIGTISLKDSRNFSKTLMAHLQSNLHVMSIEYAQEQNESVGVARDIFGNAYAIGISGRTSNYTYNLYSIDEAFGLKNITWKSENYDARKMPWYMQAKESGKPGWTPIYFWPNNEFGFDFVSPVTSNGTFNGVVDVSIQLSELQTFVDKAKYYKNTQIFLLETNGLMVAGTDSDISVSDASGSPQRVTASESKNTILKSVYAAYPDLSQIKDGDIRSLNINDTLYQVTTYTLKDNYGLNWVLFIANAESDFMAEINNTIATKALQLLVVLVLLLIVGYIIAGTITKPLTQISKFSELFAAGNFTERINIKRADEIGTLATSLNMMAEKISAHIIERQKSELTLKELNELLLMYVENSPIYTYIKSVTPTESRVVMSSKNFYEIIGGPPRNIEGKTMFELFPAEFAKKITADDWNTVATGKILTIDESLHGKNYTTIKFPIIRRGEKLLAGYSIDITERKQAEEKLEKRTKSLIEAQSIAKIGNWELNLLDNKLIWSDEIYNIFEIDKKSFEVSYDAFLSYIHPEDKIMVDTAYNESLKKHKPYSIEHRLLMTDGRIKFVQEQCQTFYDGDGKPLRSIGTVQDITQRKQMEEKLKELDKVKDDFLAITTHELKTPLIPIKSQAQLLLAGDYGTLNEKQQKAVDMIARNSDVLNTLTGEVLDIVKIKSNSLKIVLEPVDFGAIVADAVDDFTSSTKENHITLSLLPLPDIPQMKIDKLKMKQVIGNLLDNAIKFTPENGKISIGVTKSGGEITVSVKDTGIGIKAEMIPQLFTPFFQVDNSITRKYRGTGLGLPIAKGIIEAHGGKLWAESEGEGKGSTFIFTLPIKEVIL